MKTSRTESEGRSPRLIQRPNQGPNQHPIPRLIPALIILVLACVAAAGSRSFLGPCVHEDGSFGSCHWAAQALFGTALLMAVESVVTLGVRDAGMRKGLYLAMALTALLGIFLPGTLIRLCMMASMRCRAVMRPAMTVLFALMCISAAAGLVLCSDGKKRDV